MVSATLAALTFLAPGAAHAADPSVPASPQPEASAAPLPDVAEGSDSPTPVSGTDDPKPRDSPGRAAGPKPDETPGSAASPSPREDPVEDETPRDLPIGPQITSGPATSVVPWPAIEVVDARGTAVPSTVVDFTVCTQIVGVTRPRCATASSALRPSQRVVGDGKLLSRTVSLPSARYAVVGVHVKVDRAPGGLSGRWPVQAVYAARGWLDTDESPRDGVLSLVLRGSIATDPVDPPDPEPQPSVPGVPQPTPTTPPAVADPAEPAGPGQPNQPGRPVPSGRPRNPGSPPTPSTPASKSRTPSRPDTSGRQTSQPVPAPPQTVPTTPAPTSEPSAPPTVEPTPSASLQPSDSAAPPATTGTPAAPPAPPGPPAPAERTILGQILSSPLTLVGSTGLIIAAALLALAPPVRKPPLG